MSNYSSFSNRPSVRPRSQLAREYRVRKVKFRDRSSGPSCREILELSAGLRSQRATIGIPWRRRRWRRRRLLLLQVRASRASSNKKPAISAGTVFGRSLCPVLLLRSEKRAHSKKRAQASSKTHFAGRCGRADDEADDGRAAISLAAASRSRNRPASAISTSTNVAFSLLAQREEEVDLNP